MDTNYLLKVNDILIEIKNYLDEFGYLNNRMILLAKWDDLTSIINRLETHDYEPVRLDSGVILTKEGLLIDAKTNMNRIDNILFSGGERRKHGERRRRSNKRRSNKRRTNKRRHTNKRKKIFK